MRESLTGVTVRVDDNEVAGSTTIAAVGAYVLVLTTALPDHALTLASSYLISTDGAIATSHLAIASHDEQFSQRVVPASSLHATIAGACLFDHASTLRDTLAATISGAISVDIDPETLERSAEVWGPPPPPG
jgi:hypothetical protein